MPKRDSKQVRGEALSPMEIRRAGMNALFEGLGPVGFIRFMQQFDPGRGDYTNERHAWLDDLTLESIADEIRRSHPRLEPDPAGSPGMVQASEILP